MRFLFLSTLIALPLIAGCQTKGEKKAPCPPIASYAAGDALCGPVLPVNAAFQTILKE
ncbi:hypothetical protein RMS29_026585 (plasmid) [Agrobacterium rosae]|uniref:Lipoprotein n=1 Tax=Agrobacterium rosae TaxID=1972867 RepID=A0ABU4W272_9HYPH|nr:hypothetical protein [Agrobacterium rosae]MDX8331879.1 hypothetical protein [Agrobacterium rosae]